MVIKKKDSERERRIKVDKLKLNKETIKELTPSEAKVVQGGVGEGKTDGGGGQPAGWGKGKGKLEDDPYLLSKVIGSQCKVCS